MSIACVDHRIVSGTSSGWAAHTKQKLVVKKALACRALDKWLSLWNEKSWCLAAPDILITSVGTKVFHADHDVRTTASSDLLAMALWGNNLPVYWPADLRLFGSYQKYELWKAWDIYLGTRHHMLSILRSWGCYKGRMWRSFQSVCTQTDILYFAGLSRMGIGQAVCKAIRQGLGPSDSEGVCICSFGSCRQGQDAFQASRGAEWPQSHLWCPNLCCREGCTLSPDPLQTPRNTSCMALLVVAIWWFQSCHLMSSPLQFPHSVLLKAVLAC